MNPVADRRTRAATPAADEPVAGATLAPLGVQRWRGDTRSSELDWVAEEQPVSLEYNGVSHVVMMACPEALEDLGVGFSVSEGIVDAAAEILELEVLAHPLGLRVAMRITARRFSALQQRRRNLAGRTGCGLCGVDSLEQALRPLAPLPAGKDEFAAATLRRAMAALDAAQPLRARSGATHAAAWMDAGGSLHAVREDVGRHNALDKTLGALLRTGTDLRRGAALVTSRASVEMVLKAAACGVPLLVARSAPTALAVRQAQALGLTLIGFARGDGFVVYTHAARLGAGSDTQGPR